MPWPDAPSDRHASQSAVCRRMAHPWAANIMSRSPRVRLFVPWPASPSAARLVSSVPWPAISAMRTERAVEPMRSVRSIARVGPQHRTDLWRGAQIASIHGADQSRESLAPGPTKGRVKSRRQTYGAAPRTTASERGQTRLGAGLVPTDRSMVRSESTSIEPVTTSASMGRYMRLTAATIAPTTRSRNIGSIRQLRSSREVR